jgi:uroporphyrinogen decarboxylase
MAPVDRRLSSRLLRPFAGEAISPPPIWLMRQAGRYLPEYRALRAKAGSFLELCYAPALAAEAALQPVRRYGLDAAILFSDILVVPDALGQAVTFAEGEGPRLEPIRGPSDLARLRPAGSEAKFARVCEAVARLRQDLPEGTALIGFCGAPWTVATYMVEGQGSADQAQARLWAYRDPTGFARLIELLIDTSIGYLCAQIDAGADVLQIFDTWAGALPDLEFARWVVAPTQRIVAGVRGRHPEVPIIGFPRGAGLRIGDYAEATGVQGIGCDVAVPLVEMAALASKQRRVVQGNIDPLVLAAGGQPCDAAVTRLIEAMHGRPFICNLGHGVRPETPPEHVARLVALVRQAR